LININQIALTRPILDVLPFTPSNPKPKFIPQGFQLSRMDRMSSLSRAEFEELLTRDPVQVTPLRKDGVALQKNGLPLYDIVDGRHRVARAIMEHMTTILVIRGKL
jgi:hypothetical protein